MKVLVFRLFLKRKTCLEGSGLAFVFKGQA